MDTALDRLRAELGERYEIERLIAKGGMAMVYRAHDNRLDRTVAIKVLAPDLAPLLGEERFRQEIQVAAGLQHPGIVPLYEAGGSGPLQYFTMPFIEDESLRTRLDRDSVLPIDEAVRIAMEIAEALRYAHAHGVVHRDIKPENILISGERVQVADFGIARAIRIAGEARITSAGLALGTPSYMSPEQATPDRTVDGRADVYSLGCLLYEMIAGQPPFTGATPQAVVSRHLGDSVPSLKVVRHGVPPAVEEVVERALVKEPTDRPDAAELLELLRDAALHPEGHRGKWHHDPAWLVGSIAVVLALVGWFLFKPAARPLDPNAVVVLPLTSPDTAARPAGKLVAYLIESALEHTEPLRWIAAESELPAGSGTSPISRREGEQISKRLGARWYLDGVLLPVGDSLTVTLRLHDIATDSVLQQSASGLLAGDLAQSGVVLTKRAVIPLLERLVGTTHHLELTYLAHRDPAAIVIWLQGERERRSARFNEALTYYRRALDIDSTLAVAALTAAGVALWTTNAHSSADSLAKLALRHSAGLPRRNLAFTRGLIEFVAKNADSAAALFRETVAADSLWPEGWMMLGDTYYHLIPSGTGGDSIARSAFARAVALDSSFGPALFHLAEATLGRGDTTTGKRLLTRFRAVAPDSFRIPELEMMLACDRDGPSAVDWRSMARQYPQRVTIAARMLGAGARHADCAEAGMRALLEVSADSIGVGYRFVALVWIHNWLVARGEMGAAALLVDSGRVTVHPAAQGLAILDAVTFGGDPHLAQQGIDSRKSDISTSGGWWLWYLGMWAIHREDRGYLERVLDRLRSLAKDGSRVDEIIANRLGARERLMKGDTTGAIAMLAGVESAPGDVTWGVWEAGSGERLLLAQLLLATGKPAAAWRVAADLDGPVSALNLPYLPASLVVRIRAAEQLGDGATAEQLRNRLRQLGRLDLLSEVVPTTVEER